MDFRSAIWGHLSIFFIKEVSVRMIAAQSLLTQFSMIVWLETCNETITERQFKWGYINFDQYLPTVNTPAKYKPDSII